MIRSLLNPIFDSVRTDDLDVGGADFVASGNFIPWYTTVSPQDRVFSFTDTTYTGNADFYSAQVVWGGLFPSEVQTAVFGQVRVKPGTDESVSLRLRNNIDSEVIQEETGITSDQVVTFGPVNYTPTTTSSRVLIIFQWKEDNGVNSTAIENPMVSYGIQL